MAVEWTPHRFSGGALALDVANTVVHRDKPAQRFDRFADPSEIARFAEAAEQFRTSKALAVGAPQAVRPKVIAIREATDALFRDAAQNGALHAQGLAALLRAVADGIAEHAGAIDEAADGVPLPFEAALGMSALALVEDGTWRRIKVCPACSWLFLDGSRNGSRRWCDMAVCGNRNKARRNYRRQREGSSA